MPAALTAYHLAQKPYYALSAVSTALLTSMLI
ncbi:hypothetical protein Ae505Ps2_6168 [Pseudonocardia sp. Ae505_Ps2]|nr:hypothetical protein Ae505Ps2_6168 [Pseudonocardia sp. Ae505_Ps2]